MKILAESGRFPGGSRDPSTAWLLRFAYQPLRSGRQDGGAEHLIRVSLCDYRPPPEKRMRLPSGSRTMNVRAPHGSVLSV